MTASLRRGLAMLVLSALGCTSEVPPAVNGAAADGGFATSARAPWVRPTPGERGRTLSVPAEVLQTAESEAVVVAPLEARIVAVHVRPGDRVAEGDAIADVVMPELETAVAAARGAEGQHAVLKKRYERLEALQREGLAVKKDVVALEVELARVDAERRRARAVLAGAGLTRAGTHALRSPIDGIVVTSDARVGDVRHPDDGPLATVRKPIGQRVAALLARRPGAGAKAAFVRDGADAVDLKVVSSIADASGFGYRTWFEPEAGAELEAAARGQIVFRAEAVENAWRLPETCVARDDGGSFVVVARDGEPARLSVDVLQADAGHVLVRGALTPSMRVSTDPQRPTLVEAP